MEFSELVKNCLDMVTTSHDRPLVVGIGGGECTGKSYLAAQWKEFVGDKVDVIVVPMDGYLALSRAKRGKFDPNSSDFSIIAQHIGDHSSSFDLKQLQNDLESIAQGGEWIPRQYDYERGEVVIETSARKVPPESIVIVEGLFALHESLHGVVDIKVFVQTSEYFMRQQYIFRHDERKTKLDQGVIDTFDRMVLPAYRKFIAPSAEYAEYIVHNNGSTPKVRKLRFATQRITKRETMPPAPGRYKVFITHNLDNTTDFMMDVIRSVATLTQTLRLSNRRPVVLP